MPGGKLQPFLEKLKTPPYSDDFKKYLLDNFPFIKTNLVEESKIPIDVRDRILKSQNDRLKKQQLRLFRPRTHDNRRIHSQGGWHIYSPNNMSVDAWVRASFDLQVSQVPLLTKIIIPNTERSTVLTCLNKMNVNYLSLFPDFEGAAKHCNMALHEGGFFGLRDY